jgi:uncharacterized protein (TIRG00374 family)
MCTIAIAWLIESRANGYVKIKDVLEGFNWRYMILIIPIIVLGLLAKTFGDFMSLFSKTRQRRFLVMLKSNSVNEYYNSVTNYSCGGYSVYANNLNRSGVSAKLSTDITYGKKFLNSVSILIYSFIALLIGCCFVFDKKIIFLFIIGLIGFLISVGYVIFVLYFEKFKYGYMKFFGSLSKILYNMKLVKDYENFYSNTINKLITYSTALKSRKRIIITQIICGVIANFLRHLILFVILCVLNLGSLELFVIILFKATILDLIISLWPIGRGTLIFEIVFIALFRNVFFEGYVLWGMVLYRFIDYFSSVIKILISCIVRIKEKNDIQIEDEEVLEEKSISV